MRVNDFGDCRCGDIGPVDIVGEILSMKCVIIGERSEMRNGSFM